MGFFSLEKRRLQEDFTAAFQYSKGTYKKDGDKPFSGICCNRREAKGFKLKEGKFRTDVMKKFFHNEGGEALAQICPEVWWKFHPWECSRLAWMGL